LYGKKAAARVCPKIFRLIDNYRVQESVEPGVFSETDAVLITYGDSLSRQDRPAPPLQTLRRFARDHLMNIISTIHILPCFPYSSDDGFSVIDYTAVDPALGSWRDIRRLAGDFKLMLDLVLNHISAQGPWFKKYLDGAKGFEHLAIETDPASDLSGVTRPRALPLLTPFKKSSGQTVHLWTTFSADQVDLNFKDTGVLLKMVEVLLFYARQGASIIRLDAVAYLWKETGTPCVHLPQSHLVVKLLRRIFTAARQNGIIITETNVPHRENTSYFGSGFDEAHMVYNFTLPPLLLYTLIEENAEVLTRWARTLVTPSAETTFFNFTASHDGIGVRPLEGIIAPGELDKLIERVKENNGMISYKQSPGGGQDPYELNISCVDALLKKDKQGMDPLHIHRFLAAQAIQLTLPGVPGIYIHSLLGSRNWHEGVRQTGRARSINREKLTMEKVTAELAQPHSSRRRVFDAYRHMLKVRRSQPAFHPNAACEVPDIGPGIFAVIRKSARQTLYALTNISSRPLRVECQAHRIPTGMIDRLTGKPANPGTLELAPYQPVWLTPPEDQDKFNGSI
jgi:sucrose phosphorylase